MKSQLIAKASTAACLTCFILGTSINAHAFGMPSFGGGGSSSSVDTAKLVETSKEMVEYYKLAMITVTRAQSEAFLAVNEGEKAEEAKQLSNAWASGQTKEELEKLTAGTKEYSKEVQNNVIGGEKLQGNARVHLAKSATMYTGASYAGVKILESMKKWSSDATAAMSSLKTDPMKLASFKNDIEPGLYVMSNLPGLSSDWVSTASKLVEYAKINGDTMDGDEVDKVALNAFPLQQ